MFLKKILPHPINSMGKFFLIDITFRFLLNVAGHFFDNMYFVTKVVTSQDLNVTLLFMS